MSNLNKAIKEEIQYVIESFDDREDLKKAFMILENKTQKSVVNDVCCNVLDDNELWQTINETIEYYLRRNPHVLRNLVYYQMKGE